MAARWLGAVFVVLAGIFGAIWYSAAAFTTSETVMATPPEWFENGERAPTERQQQEVFVRCNDDAFGDQYVSAEGALVGFNEVSWTYPAPEPLCDAARGERRTNSIVIVLLAFLAALLLIAEGRLRQGRRRVTAQFAPDARRAVSAVDER